MIKEIFVYVLKNRKKSGNVKVKIDHDKKVFDEVIEENKIVLDKERTKFRTFHILNTLDEHIYQEVIGRVIAVTIPVVGYDNIFAVDFAFCSKKDMFSRKVGQQLALTRIREKMINNNEVFYIIKNDGSVNDTIKEMIVNEFGSKIHWLRKTTVDKIV